MSKAFTKESDDEQEDDLPSQPPSASLPPGTRNYLTASGARRLRDELETLTASAQNGETTQGGVLVDDRRRRSLKRRAAEIEQILRSAEVVAAPAEAEARNKVSFGATVTVREVHSREQFRYQIVGVDELDLGEDRVSLHAPVARALLNARVGERVRFRFPAGEELLEIVSVDYE